MDIFVNSFGKVIFGVKEYPCALGKNGVAMDKKEGDGMTPIGCFPLREVFYRSDRLEKPETKLPVSEIERNDSWCDDVDRQEYNKKIKLPFSGSHEELWRNEDNLYDIIVVVGYNDSPVVFGKGSAIFLHIARPEFTPTLGCIAFKKEDLLGILKSCDLETKVCVQK